jgi:hypothetical protein
VSLLGGYGRRRTASRQIVDPEGVKRFFDLPSKPLRRDTMQEISPKMEREGKAKDERENPIEGAATGVTGGGNDPVPPGDPDPRRPPYGDPTGGKGAEHH